MKYIQLGVWLHTPKKFVITAESTCKRLYQQWTKTQNPQCLNSIEQEFLCFRRWIKSGLFYNWKVEFEIFWVFHFCNSLAAWSNRCYGMWWGTKEDPETLWPLREASLPILWLLYSALLFSIPHWLFGSVSLLYFDVVQVYSDSAVLLRAHRRIPRATQAGACTKITLFQTGMCGNLPSGYYLCNLHLKLVGGPRRQQTQETECK